MQRCSRPKRRRLGAMLLGAVEPSERLDFFSHPQGEGLLVLDERLCLPGAGNVRIHFHAGSATEQFRLQLLRPFEAEVGAGYQLLEAMELQVEEGLQSLQLPFAFQAKDCLAWQSWRHGVISFHEELAPASVKLLLPGAPLRLSERIEARHFAQVARRYALQLEVDVVPSPASDADEREADAVRRCRWEEIHWALSSAAGSQQLPEGDGIWSMGNRRMCESLGHEFQSGRFSFLGEHLPLQFGLCAPAQCDRNDASEQLLARLAPEAVPLLRQAEFMEMPRWAAGDHWGLVLALLCPALVGLAAEISFSWRAGRCSPCQALRRLFQPRLAQREAQLLRRLGCCLLGLLHLLLGLDVFCAPEPPAFLWRDLDTVLGYVSTQAMLLLSARWAAQAGGPRELCGRLLRKWLRLAPAGLALRLLFCPLPARWRHSGVSARRSAGDTLAVDCRLPRCSSAPTCAEPLEGLPFGGKDVIMAFPEVADVGWFLDDRFDQLLAADAAESCRTPSRRPALGFGAGGAVGLVGAAGGGSVEPKDAVRLPARLGGTPGHCLAAPLSELQRGAAAGVAYPRPAPGAARAAGAGAGGGRGGAVGGGLLRHEESGRSRRLLHRCW
ncbi:unnamed protein product [Effrenium voratum]|uniref:Uncharacterized protein n=1 Tax=Effrenium voratum TaxID=2562239 RepID=A0AA36IHL0_9DINO|nr:unnamed protein product [Effrenium voratum]